MKDVIRIKATGEPLRVTDITMCVKHDVHDWRDTGRMKLSHPPQFVERCKRCGKERSRR